MTKELIYHYSMQKLSIGAVSVIVSSFFLTLGHPVHADTINNANVVQMQSNNNKSTASIAINTKQVVIDQAKTTQSSLPVTKTNQFAKSKVKAIKKANTSIMPKFKIALSNKKLAVNKIKLHNKSETKTKLHKIAALLPQTDEDKGTVIGIIGALVILLALISFKKPKENKKD